MIQLPCPCTIDAQTRNVTLLTIKSVVRKIQKHDGQMGSCAWTRQCLDKRGGGMTISAWQAFSCGNHTTALTAPHEDGLDVRIEGTCGAVKNCEELPAQS